MKKEVTDCVTLIGDLKVHIQLSIPKIEDGNNFGVQVQEDIVSELDRSESSCIQVIENLHKYYITRAKIVSKVLKYPGLMDYQQALIECDLKQYEVLKLSLLDLRNTLALLYSLVTKNIEKLRKPKESHHMRAMY